MSLEPHGHHGHAFSPLGRPLPALRLRLGVGLAVDELGLLRLEGGGARDVVRVEGEHVDPVAVALQRPAQRAVARTPHLNGAVLRDSTSGLIRSFLCPIILVAHLKQSTCELLATPPMD